MTELLDQAIARVRTMPSDVQDAFARVLLDLAAEDDLVIQLTPEEVASFAKSRSQAAQREFATDEQVRAVWSKHGF